MNEGCSTRMPGASERWNPFVFEILYASGRTDRHEYSVKVADSKVSLSGHKRAGNNICIIPTTTKIYAMP